MKEYCFGIDVGGTTIKIGFFKNNGEVLDKWEITTKNMKILVKIFLQIYVRL